MDFRFRLGELFCGAGGLALGAKQAKVLTNSGNVARIESVWANDQDRHACATYAANIGGRVEWKDVADLDMADLGFIDLFAFGFPCNDFSMLGDRAGADGKYGGLYKYGVKAIEHFRPMAWVAENVSGIHSADAGTTFKRILADLERAGDGYEVVTHHYRCEDYGVPQRRHRYLIVGMRRDLKVSFRVPAPTHLGCPVTVRQALADIPANAPNHETRQLPPQVVERLSYIKPGQNMWQADIPPHLMFNMTSQAKISSLYRRLHPDEPSYTIVASGNGGMFGYHHEELRAITNRERARLQSFPDDFIFSGQVGQVRRQIGMAVPPTMSRVIFEAVLKTIYGLDYPSVPPNYRG